MKDTNSLSHIRYRCKYHMVIIPKYSRLVIYGKIRRDIIEILKLLEGEACRDHIHMLVEIPPKYAVSQIMGISNKSALMIFDRHADMKYKYGNRHF